MTCRFCVMPSCVTRNNYWAHQSLEKVELCLAYWQSRHDRAKVERSKWAMEYAAGNSSKLQLIRLGVWGLPPAEMAHRMLLFLQFKAAPFPNAEPRRGVIDQCDALYEHGPHERTVRGIGWGRWCSGRGSG